MYLYKTSILPAECLFSLRSFDRPKTFTWHESPKTHCATVFLLRQPSFLLPLPSRYLRFYTSEASPSGIKTKIDKPFVSSCTSLYPSTIVSFRGLAKLCKKKKRKKLESRLEEPRKVTNFKARQYI